MMRPALRSRTQPPMLPRRRRRCSGERRRCGDAHPRYLRIQPNRAPVGRLARASADPLRCAAAQELRPPPPLPTNRCPTPIPSSDPRCWPGRSDRPAIRRASAGRWRHRSPRWPTVRADAAAVQAGPAVRAVSADSTAAAGTPWPGPAAWPRRSPTCRSADRRAPARGAPLILDWLMAGYSGVCAGMESSGHSSSASRPRACSAARPRPAPTTRDVGYPTGAGIALRQQPDRYVGVAIAVLRGVVVVTPAVAVVFVERKSGRYARVRIGGDTRVRRTGGARPLRRAVRRARKPRPWCPSSARRRSCCAT